METIGTFLNKRSSLTEREVELVIVIIATQWEGIYVQAAHVKMCLDRGYRSAVIGTIDAGAMPELPDIGKKEGLCRGRKNSPARFTFQGFPCKRLPTVFNETERNADLKIALS